MPPWRKDLHGLRRRGTEWRHSHGSGTERVHNTQESWDDPSGKESDGPSADGQTVPSGNTVKSEL